MRGSVAEARPTSESSGDPGAGSPPPSAPSNDPSPSSAASASPTAGFPLRTLADAPVDNDAADRFGYGDIADGLARLIDGEETATPLTIAVSAPWGAGKTSLLRLVENRVVRQRVEQTVRCGPETPALGTQPLAELEPRIRGCLPRVEQRAKLGHKRSERLAEPVDPAAARQCRHVRCCGDSGKGTSPALRAFTSARRPVQAHLLLSD